jgi:hypothetical protein
MAITRDKISVSDVVEPYDKEVCARCLSRIEYEGISPEHSTCVSTGFGMYNEEWYYFCSLVCRARAIGRDPVLERYPQATLDNWLVSPPGRRITYSV